MTPTLYAYSTMPSRISSMNSYLLAAGDPSPSTLWLFSGRRLPSQAHVAPFGLLQTSPLAHRQFRVLGDGSRCSGTSSPSPEVSLGSVQVLGQLPRSSCSTSARSGTASSRNSGEYLLGGAFSLFLFRATLLGPCPEASGNLRSPRWGWLRAADLTIHAVLSGPDTSDVAASRVATAHDSTTTMELQTVCASTSRASGSCEPTAITAL